MVPSSIFPLIKFYLPYSSPLALRQTTCGQPDPGGRILCGLIQVTLCPVVLNVTMSLINQVVTQTWVFFSFLPSPMPPAAIASFCFFLITEYSVNFCLGYTTKGEQ